MSVDSIGNFLTVLRNAVMVSKPFVVVPYSRMNAEIARILAEEGFVQGVEHLATPTERKQLKVVLRYVEGESVIHALTRISKPSRRIYVGAKTIKPVVGGLGISILSTNRGVMTDKRAKSAETFVGGEVMCTVW